MYSDNPMRTWRGKLKQIIHAGKNRKNGKWILPLSIRLTIEDYARDITELLNEVLRIRALEAHEKHPYVTVGDLQATLMEV